MDLYQQALAAKQAEIEQSYEDPNDNDPIETPHPAEIGDGTDDSDPEGDSGVPAGSGADGAPDPGEPQGDPGGNQEPSGASDEITLPEWFPDHLRPKPDSDFDYKRAFAEVANQLADPSFYEGFVEAYRDDIASKVQEIDNFKQHFAAFQKDPVNYLKTWMPEAYEEIGAKPLTDEEIGEQVQSKMAEEFGEDWRQIFNGSEIYIPGTPSRRMNQRMGQLEQELIAKNKEIEQKIEQRRLAIAQGGAQQQPTRQYATPEEAAEATWNDVKEVFEKEGLTREQYAEFVQQNAERQVTMLDIYRGTNYARDVEAARKAGIEEGRKALSKELGVAYRTPEPAPEPKDDETPAQGTDPREAYHKKRSRPLFS